MLLLTLTQQAAPQTTGIGASNQAPQQSSAQGIVFVPGFSATMVLPVVTSATLVCPQVP